MPALRLPYPHSSSTDFSDTWFWPRWRSLVTTALTALLIDATLLTGYNGGAPEALEIHPVRTMTVTSKQGADTTEFSGDIYPRIESRLSLHVPDRIIVRLVDAGTTVKRGQVLAWPDPTDLTLTQQSAQTQLSTAETDCDLAAADLKRYSELLTKDPINATERQRHQTSYDAMQVRHEQTGVGYRNQVN